MSAAALLDVNAAAPDSIEVVEAYRAEYAYPSEFIVPAALAEDPVLLAFGVPITIDDNDAAAMAQLHLNKLFPLGWATQGSDGRPKAKMSPWLKFPVALNLGLALLNLLLSGRYFFG